MKANTHCKTNLRLPYQTFAFHQKQPLLQAEILSEWCGHSLGRRQSLCSPMPPLQNTWGLQCSHFGQVSPQSGGNRPGPPWPVCSMGSTHQLHQKTIAFGVQTLARLKALLSQSPPATAAGREQPGPLPYQLAYHHGACLFQGSLPVHEHWRLEGDTGSGSQAVAKANCVKLWASNYPWQKTFRLAVLAATDKSHKSDSQNFHFRRCY